MSLTAPMIDALLATGGTVEQLAAMVKADLVAREAEEEAKRAAKREGNLARQHRHRARNAVSRAVTPVTRDTPPIEEVLTPPKITPPKPSGLDPTPKKHRLPSDWEPQSFKAGSMAALTVLRWEPGRLERELAKFRDHHTAVGTKWENWQSAWSKWINQSEDFQRGRNGGHHQHLGKTSAAIAGLGDWQDDRPM